MSTQSYKPRLLAGIDYGAIRAIVREVLEEVLQSVRVYGTTASGEVKPILVNDEGRLVINATTSAETSSVTIYGLDYEENVRRAVAVDSSARLRSVVENFPSDYPDSGTHTRLDTIISRLDVNLSTRASESTVSTIADRLYDSTEGKSITTIVKEIRDKPEWGYLPNLDVALSTRASEQTLSIVADRLYDSAEAKSITTIVKEIRDKTEWSYLPNLDITLSSLRDAIVGTDARTLTDIYNELAKFSFDAESDLYVTRRVEELTPVDYTTTDTWAVAAQYDISKYDEVTILIGNTGTNPADIYVAVMVNSAGQLEYPEYGSSSSPITLNSGQVAKVQLSGRYAIVKVYAKNNVDGSSTTLRVEAIGAK